MSTSPPPEPFGPEPGTPPENPYASPQAPGAALGPGEPGYVASDDERLWAMLCHLSTFVGYVVPFGHVIAPLVIWLIQREKLPLVDDQGKEAVNFQISMTIYYLVAGLSIFIVIGCVLLPAALIFDLVVTIIAAVKANQGVAYRYPLCIRFIT